jgi:hypothetical protein
MILIGRDGTVDAETLTFLLGQGHLNMQERTKRGLWPHPPLKFDDVLHHLIQVLQTQQWFPPAWRPAVPGEPVHEGGAIERQSPFRYVYHWQRSHPVDPRLLAEQGEKVFRSAKAAARYYLKWDLHLPGDLDGWRVVR